MFRAATCYPATSRRGGRSRFRAGSRVRDRSRRIWEADSGQACGVSVSADDRPAARVVLMTAGRCAFWDCRCLADGVRHFRGDLGVVGFQAVRDADDLAGCVGWQQPGDCRQLRVFDGAQVIVEHRQVAPAGELKDLVCGVGWQQAGDERRRTAHRVQLSLGVVESAGPAVEVGVDDDCG